MQPHLWWWLVLGAKGGHPALRRLRSLSNTKSGWDNKPILVVPLGRQRILVIICVDAGPLWRRSTTRAEVFIRVWPSGPTIANMPRDWATFWMMASWMMDNRTWLCRLDQVVVFSSVPEHLEASVNTSTPTNSSV